MKFRHILNVPLTVFLLLLIVHPVWAQESEQTTKQTNLVAGGECFNSATRTSFYPSLLSNGELRTVGLSHPQ